jgi:hypothetical protein
LTLPSWSYNHYFFYPYLLDFVFPFPLSRMAAQQTQNVVLMSGQFGPGQVQEEYLFWVTVAQLERIVAFCHALDSQHLIWLRPGLRLQYPSEWELVFTFRTLLRLIEFVQDFGTDGFLDPSRFRDTFWLCSPASLLDVAILLNREDFLGAIVSLQDPQGAAKALSHMIVNYGIDHGATQYVVNILASEYGISIADLFLVYSGAAPGPAFRLSAICTFLQEKQRADAVFWADEGISGDDDTCPFCWDKVSLISSMKPERLGIRVGTCLHVGHLECVEGLACKFLGACPACPEPQLLSGMIRHSGRILHLKGGR